MARGRGAGRQQGPGVPPLVAARAERPPGGRQLGELRATISTAVRPTTGEDVTLVLPTVDAEASARSSSITSRPRAHRTPTWRSSGKLSPGQLPDPPRSPPRSPTAPAGPRAAPSPCPTTSPSSSRRPPIKPGAGSTAPSPTRWSASGSTCASASSRCAFALTCTITGARLATPGCASSPNAIGSGRSATAHGSRRSRHRLIGIISLGGAPAARAMSPLSVPAWEAPGGDWADAPWVLQGRRNARPVLDAVPA